MVERSLLHDRVNGSQSHPMRTIADSVGATAAQLQSTARSLRRPVVVSLMDRNTTILGGQEIRWGRIAKALSSFDETEVTILCTRTLVEAWKRSEVGELDTKIAIFEERHSKFATWIEAQLFALRHIPRGAIVHLTGVGMLILPAAILAHLFKNATVLTSLTTSRVLPLRNGNQTRRSYWVLWTALKWSHVVDALNPQIDVTGIVDNRKLFIAPCSFSDPERYRSADRKLDRVVFAGHFVRQKGSELLVQMVKEWPQGETCELVLCGSGPYEAQLRSAAEQNANVRILRIDRISEILAGAKVFLSLQQWDNYPSQSLLEAMLCQCCVVATDTGDTERLVRSPWGTRLPVDAPARAYIDAALQYVGMDEQMQMRVGAAARAFVVEQHSESRYLSYLHGLWRTADCWDTSLDSASV